MSTHIRPFTFAIAMLYIFANFQALSFPHGFKIQAGSGSTPDQIQRFKNELRYSAFVRQENTGYYKDDDDSTSSNSGYDSTRFKDFIKGINGILNGLLTLDFANIIGGSLKFIPPSVRKGVENIVGTVIGKPKATTQSSINVISIFAEEAPPSNITTSTDLQLALDSENEPDFDELEMDRRFM